MSWAVAGIRHTSAGRGHPYRIDPDQRHPVQLVGGDPFELRVLTDPTVAAVTVELDDGAAVPMQRVTLDDLYGDAGDASGDGHLAAASGSRPDVGCAQPWRVRLTAPPHGVVGYRFVAAGCSTERFVAPVGVWSAAGGELSLVGDEGHGDGRVVATDWLVTDDGVVRARIALALAAGDHVVGFGERFDRLDQRGQALDADGVRAVQAAGQPHLPADAVRASWSAPSAGWGFHVRTHAGSDFDVGHAADDRLLIEAELSTRREPDRRAAPVRRRLRPRSSPPSSSPRPAACDRAAGLGVPAVDERQRVEHPGAGAGRGGAQRRPRASRSAPW